MNIPKAVRINLSISVVIITVLFFALKPHKVNTVPPPVQVIKVQPDNRENKIQDAAWEVAKVFGRSPGCKDASPELGRMIAEASIDQGADPKIVAATASIESNCNQFAVSSKGAIGIMQVTAKTWSSKYDFTGSVNLLNSRDNVKVGTKILSDSIKQYGLEKGIQAYNGLAIGCSTCDEYYSQKVL